jgi:molybdopterin adenylyltransferase
MAAPPRIGILTVSDRAAAGVYEDRGGPAVRAALDAALDGPWVAVARIVSDDLEDIRRALVALVDSDGCALVLTTGGTGPAPRDVTPEATRAVCDRELPGFGEAMRAASRARVPTAILSRQTAGVRGAALIVNLPGSPGGAVECLQAVLPAAAHGVAVVGGPRLSVIGSGGDPHT